MQMSRRGKWRILIYVDYDEYEIYVNVEKDGRWRDEREFSLDPEEVEECARYVYRTLKEIREDYEKVEGRK